MYEKIEAILCELLVIKRHVKYTQLKYMKWIKGGVVREKGARSRLFFFLPPLNC
jgi:hypothetical protein